MSDLVFLTKNGDDKNPTKEQIENDKTHELLSSNIDRIEARMDPIEENLKE